MTDSECMGEGSSKNKDGGYGWLVVAGSFLAYFIADGWAYSIGVFFPVFLESLNEGHGKTALIGALVYGVPLLVSPIVCALTNIYGCRIVIFSSGILCMISFSLASLSSSIDVLCLTLGILASIGLAMVYIPAIVIVTYYFEERRGLATGIAMTGSALGAFAFPPFVEYLLEQYAWRGTLLIIGAIFLHVCIVGVIFRPPPSVLDSIKCKDLGDKHEGNRNGMHIKKQAGNILIPRLHEKTQVNGERSRSEQEMHKVTINQNDENQLSIHTLHAPDLLLSQTSPLLTAISPENLLTTSCPDIYVMSPKTLVNQSSPPTKGCLGKFLDELSLIMKTMFDKSLASCWAYLLFCGASFVLYLWVGMPYVYLVDAAQSQGLEMSKAIFLLSITGIGRGIGQITLGYIGDLKTVSTLLLYAVAIIVAGIGTALVPVLSTHALLIIYSASFGFLMSVTYSIIMMCLVEIIGLERVTSGFGLLQLFQGIATVLGTPVAGWLYESLGNYSASFYTTGGFIFFSGLLMLPVSCMSWRKKGNPA